jgi:hypothetical protein
MEVELIKSNGVAWEAKVIAYSPLPARSAALGGFAFTSISLGRNHEVGIVEPMELEDGLVPTPSSDDAGSPDQCERLELTAA